jgi:hypothetical protein
MADIAYHIYEQNELQKLVDESKGEKRVSLHIFEFGELKFAIVYKPDYLKGAHIGNTQHMAFHALSEGFEAYTSTGYKSNFVHYEGMVSDEELRAFWIEELKKENFDLENPAPRLRTSGIDKINEAAVQLSLF